MNIVLLGLPGAGKGTQAKKINREFGLPHIATGDIFRKAIKDETALGVKAKEYLDTGELVPDEVTNGIVKQRLAEDDCRQGFILDGYPRTMNQARALSSMLDEWGNRINLALYIKVSQEELIKRLSGRRVCSECGTSYHIHFNPPEREGICDKCGGKLIQRSDDKRETVKNRIKINREKIEDLLSYYREKDVLEEIESSGGIDEVFALIKPVIKEKINDNN